jgi:hypothetical protein
MIEVEFFAFTDAQWDAIKEQVLDDLGVDADQIERQVTVRHTGPDFEESFTGMEPLRSRIESVVSLYRLHSDVKDRSQRRDDLGTLRKEAEGLRDSILGTVAVPFRAKTEYDFPAHPLLLNGVDADMLTATRDYFRKLLANLDRMIDRAGSSRDNARKTARDQCWGELLAIWRELGGKPRSIAAAEFLKLASLPVMGSAVPNLKSVRRWLDRRPE